MDKKTTTIIIIIILAATVSALGVRFFSGSEDSWICQNGQWIKHGNPSEPQPTAQCPVSIAAKDNIQKNGQDKDNDNILTDDSAGNDLKIIEPAPNAKIGSALEATGEARGTWFFEGDFPVKLVDRNDKVIAQAPARALGEWMTTDFVPFRAILEFSAPKSGTGTLIFTRDDPSDQAVTKEVKIPVTLGGPEGMKVKLFFSSFYFDPESANCEKVYEVERVVPKTKAVAKAATEELLGGITEEEKSGGYLTGINSGVKLNKISIANGVAKVDFSPELENGVGGSCRTSMIAAQITETLKQFPTVKGVIISVDGKTDALQP